MKIKAVLIAELTIEDESPPLSDQSAIQVEVTRRLQDLFDTTKTATTIRVPLRRPLVTELDNFIANDTNWLVE